MKLAILSSGLFRHTGGPPVVISNLVNQLLNWEEISTHYFGIKGDVHPEVDKLKLRVGYKDFKPFTAYRFSLNYLFCLIKYSPDIVWVHGLWLWPNLAGILYATLSGKKLILTPHGVLTQQMFSRKWYKKITIGFLELLMLLIKKNLTIHYLSLAEKESCILNRFDLNNQIIPNFVNTQKEIKIRRNKNFIYLARIAPIKGIEDLVSIKDVDCDIFGFGESNYVKKVLLGNTSYKGEVQNSEVSSLFSRYEFYILPSYGEGLPTSAIEAAFCGCLLIISNECNLNMFTNEVDCIMFPAGKANLEKAIKCAQEMTLEQKQEMQRNSLETVNKFFGHKELSLKYKSLILS